VAAILYAKQGSFHFRNTTVDTLIDSTNKAWSQEVFEYLVQ